MPTRDDTSRRPNLGYRLASLALVLMALCLGMPVAAFQPDTAPKAKELKNGTNEIPLFVGGKQRRYVLYVPRSLDRFRPAPLILAFHGGGSNPEQFAKVTRLDAMAADRQGYVVAYPAGYKNFWHSGDDCCGPPQEEGVDDVAFVRAVLEDIRSRLPIDPSRVYAMGFSNGGKMTYRVACTLTSELTAIAVTGSSIGVKDCRPSKPLPVLHFHGTADTFHPYAGGPGTATQFQMPQTGAPETMRRWQQWDGCSTRQKTAYQKGDATCVANSECRDGTEVVLCTIEGMGHQWPGFTVRFPISLARKLGPSTDDLDATSMALDFFSRHTSRH